MKKHKFITPITKSKSRYLTKEQANAILELLDNEELPEHELPFKLYFNGKMIGSSITPKKTKTK